MEKKGNDLYRSSYETNSGNDSSRLLHIGFTEDYNDATLYYVDLFEKSGVYKTGIKQSSAVLIVTVQIEP